MDGRLAGLAPPRKMARKSHCLKEFRNIDCDVCSQRERPTTRRARGAFRLSLNEHLPKGAQACHWPIPAIYIQHSPARSLGSPISPQCPPMYFANPRRTADF
jgi:hypothetical protein